MMQLRQIMDTGVRRASAFMALGLRSANDESIRSVRLDANFSYLFMADPLTPEVSTEVRGNFGKWVIGNGLRELYQFSGIFLDRLYPVLVASQSGAVILPDMSKKLRVMEEITSVSGKMKKIADEFDIVVPTSEHLPSISLVRNALTHKLGRVGERQTNEGSSLRVTWLGYDFLLGSQTVSGPFAPVVVEEGGEVKIKSVGRA